MVYPYVESVKLPQWFGEWDECHFLDHLAISIKDPQNSQMFQDPKHGGLTGAFHARNGWEWEKGNIINSYEMGHSLIPYVNSTSKLILLPLFYFCLPGDSQHFKLDLLRSHSGVKLIGDGLGFGVLRFGTWFKL